MDTFLKLVVAEEIDPVLFELPGSVSAISARYKGGKAYIHAVLGRGTYGGLQFGFERFEDL